MRILKTFLIISVTLLLGLSSFAQEAVHDVLLTNQVWRGDVEKLQVMNKQLDRITVQLETCKLQLDRTDKMLKTIEEIEDHQGDPAKVKAVIDRKKLTLKLKGKSMDKVRTQAKQVTSANQAKELYGEANAPAANPKLKFQAVEAAYDNYEDTAEAVAPRRQELIDELEKLVKKVEEAETEVEVQKVTAAINAINGALQGLADSEKQAHNQLNAQQTRNENQRQAKAERQAQEEIDSAKAGLGIEFPSMKETSEWLQKEF